MRVETFRVVLSGFKVRELPKKRCSAFVVGNFDNFKQFKSNSADNELYGAKWEDLELMFYYETKFISKLNAKTFELALFEKRLIKNARLGTCTVDLHTLSTGPVHHDIMLLNKQNISIGRIEFDCVFEHIPNLTLCLPNGYEMQRNIEIYLQISFYPDTKNDVIYKTDISRTSSKFFLWQQLTIIRPNVSIKKLLATKMLIEVKEKRSMTKDSSIGVCWVKFKRIFNPESPNTPVPINFKLTKYIHRYHPQHVSCETTASSSSSNHGMLKGYFLFENSPMYGQMVDGVHTENGVFRGTALLAGLPKPMLIRHPDSPDGRFSSIGGYYDNYFDNKDGGHDDTLAAIEREKLDFDRFFDKENSAAASNSGLEKKPKKARHTLKY